MKAVKYPIPHDEEGGSLFLFGKPDSARIVLMCAGFPDDQSAFMSLAERLSQKKCFAGVTCLPGYDKPGYKDGYSFHDWSYCMQEATKALRAQSTATPTAKFTGIYHDWGCVAGGMFSTSALESNSSGLIPDEIILFDVGMPPHPKADTKNLPVEGSILTTLYTVLVTFSYQIVLAKSFLLQRYISKYLAYLQYLIGFTVLKLLRLVPLGNVDGPHVQERAKALPYDHFLYMAYPYYNVWKAILTGKAAKEVNGFCLPLDLKKTPVLYLYGTEKNIHFHDPKSVALLQREEEQGHRSKVVGVQNAGHWLYVQQEDICFQEISKFLGL